MNEKQLPFKWGNKLGVSEQMYGNIPFITNMIQRLLYCMKETNMLHGDDCEFFRLDFRTPHFDELDQFPNGALILDLKWGFKEE